MDAQVNKLEPTCTESGDPLPKQRRLVQRAMNRGQLARKVRCLVGKHNPPHDKVFNEMGAIMIGGPCTVCDDPVERELVWIGNEGDFPGTATVTKTQRGISYQMTDFNVLFEQVNKHLQYLHS
jgi:hypothetical protein